jgi:hypothetical protein
LHHLENILGGHVIGSDGFDEGFVAYVSGVITDEVEVQLREEFFDEESFTAPRRTEHVYPFFEVDVFAVGFVVGENLGDVFYDVFSFEELVHGV